MTTPRSNCESLDSNSDHEKAFVAGISNDDFNLPPPDFEPEGSDGEMLSYKSDIPVFDFDGFSELLNKDSRSETEDFHLRDVSHSKFDPQDASDLTAMTDARPSMPSTGASSALPGVVGSLGISKESDTSDPQNDDSTYSHVDIDPQNPNSAYSSIDTYSADLNLR